jgi:tetratricopeptide (TPR) repeat protein
VFRQGNYGQALKQVDLAIRAAPKDAVLHEFRALCLFAMKRYDEAAQVLYAVLAAGPGWDWQTMSSCYTDTNTYAKQLQALEAYVKSHSKSAPANFVLAYHYMCLGELQASASLFKVVTELQPQDTVSAALLKSVTASS